MRSIVLLWVAMLLSPALAKANATTKSEHIAETLSSVGRLTKLIEAQGRKLAPKGCEGVAKRVHRANVASLARFLLNDSHTVKANCKAVQHQLSCQLVYVGIANETHDWSATLDFKVRAATQKVIKSSFSCEIVG